MTRDEAIIFHFANARPQFARPVKNYLKNSGCEVLPQPPYSTYLNTLTTLLTTTLLVVKGPFFRQQSGTKRQKCIGNIEFIASVAWQRHLVAVTSKC